MREVLSERETQAQKTETTKGILVKWLTVCAEIHSKRDRSFTEGGTFELTKDATNYVLQEKKWGWRGSSAIKKHLH